MLPTGIIVLQDNITNLENRIKSLMTLEAHVGVTEQDGIHHSGLNYVDLATFHSNGNSEMGIPARDIATWSLLTFPENNAKIKRGLQQYLGDIHKPKAPITAEQFGKIWANEMYPHSLTMFGNTQYLESNAPSTIKMKGRDDPMVWTGDLRDTWNIKINGKKVSL